MKMSMRTSTLLLLVTLVMVIALLCETAKAQTDEELNTPKVVTVVERKGEIQSLIFNQLKRSDGSLVGAGVVTSSRSTGVIWEESQSFGVGGSNRDRPMSLDSCMNMNTASELLVVFAFIQIHQQHNIPVSLDDDISAAHSPGGVQLINPHNQKPLTYKQLMTHTSTLNDAGFEGFTVTTPNTVGSLKEFIETRYFLTAGGQLVSSIFSKEEPGTSAAFRHAKINTALLAYILEVILGPSVLQTAHSNVQSYIYQQVLNPFGMSSTFFLANDGSAPGIVLDGTAAASYYQGCIVDQFNVGVKIHPAVVPDYMVYTTPSDFARLIYHLFIDDKYQAISVLMKEQMKVTTSQIASQIGQGLGLQYFDGAKICAAAIGTKVIASCPLLNTSTVIGYIAQRDHVTISAFCSNTNTYGMLCTSSMLLYATSALRTPNSALAMAAATFQELTGSVIVQTEAPKPALRDEDEERVFGVYIFLGVYLSVLFVIFGTTFLQWALNPAAIASNTDTGAAAGMGPDAASPGKSNNEPSILPQTD